MPMDLAGLVARLDEQLADADAELAALYPGTRPGRQPVHTIYVPAHRYGAGLVARHGRAAQMRWRSTRALFLRLIDDDEDLLHRVRTKLEREPVEDLRIDFEDGYGDRGDDAEDDGVARAARALRAELAGGRGAAVVRDPVQELRAAHAATRGPDPGRVRRPALAAGRRRSGRVRGDPAQGHLGRPGRGDGAHLRPPGDGARPDGARLASRSRSRLPRRSSGRTAPPWSRRWSTPPRAGAPACTTAPTTTAPSRHPRGVPVPRPPGRRSRQGRDAGRGGRHRRPPLRRVDQHPPGRREPDQVRRGWATHLRLVRRSLERGFYQGWDLHPAQLPTRYAATYAFFRDGLDDATERLHRYGHAREAGGRRRAGDGQGAGGLPGARPRVRCAREDESPRAAGTTSARSPACARPDRTTH